MLNKRIAGSIDQDPTFNWAGPSPSGKYILVENNKVLLCLLVSLSLSLSLSLSVCDGAHSAVGQSCAQNAALHQRVQEPVSTV
jgi:hypothetical protein